jgi:hypothetical protein
LPWRHDENRSDERDREEHERSRRADVSAECLAIRTAFMEIATNRSPINAPLAVPATTPKLSQLSPTTR